MKIFRIIGFLIVYVITMQEFGIQISTGEGFFLGIGIGLMLPQDKEDSGG